MRGVGERLDELGDLGFVGVADDPGDAGKGGEFFWGALGIATGDDHANSGIGSMEFANGVAGLGIGGGRDRAGVDDNDVGSVGRADGSAAAVKQLALEGSAIGLRGTATELFDEESWHLRAAVAAGDSQHRAHKGHREELTPFCASANSQATQTAAPGALQG